MKRASGLDRAPNYERYLPVTEDANASSAEALWDAGRTGTDSRSVPDLFVETPVAA